MSSSDSLSSMGEHDQSDLNSTHSRPYPSINDFYNASRTEKDKPIQLQSGLSNYSSLVLGDDRISVSDSISTATYRSAVEEKMTIESPSRAKTTHMRRKEYQEAVERVGQKEIDRLERVMKDKLVQRSLKTSSAFQVNKAFKFFDREQCLRIPIEGFTRALEFLGFQFSEIQNLALFSRYDTECEGEIIYMDFISKAMFFLPSDDVMAPRSPHFAEGSNSFVFADDETSDEVKDFDLAQLKSLQEAEMRRIFSKVDRGNRGSIDKVDLELLLMAIGHNASTTDVASYLFDMGLSDSDRGLTYEVFYEWWCNKDIHDNNSQYSHK